MAGLAWPAGVGHCSGPAGPDGQTALQAVKHPTYAEGVALEVARQAHRAVRAAAQQLEHPVLVDLLNVLEMMRGEEGCQ